MTWEYYYDEDTNQTVYYHDGKKVTTLDGMNTTWQNGLPYGEHLEGIRDTFQSAGTPERIAMTYDLHSGFKELNEPY